MNEVDRVITDEYERYKTEVLRTVASKLAVAGARLDTGDLEAPYNEAWHALYLKMSEGEEIGNRVGFLVTVTHRRAISEYRASRVDRRANDVDLDKVGEEMDLDAQLDAEIKIRHVIEGLRANLSEREFEAATLCHLHGFSRSEAAAAIGVKPKRMEKIMDGASTRIATVIERVRSGEHCEAMSSLVRAFAVGLLTPDGEKYVQAEEHLSHCPACRRQVWVLRGLAAGAPPIPAVIALAGGSVGTGGMAAGGSPGGAARKVSPAGAAGTVSAAAAARVGKQGKRSGKLAGAAAAAAVAVAAIVVAAILATGGDSEQTEPPSNSSSGQTDNSQAKQALKAQAKAQARAKAKARAERIRSRQRAERKARIAEAAETAPEASYVSPPPEPEYVAPAPEPSPVPAAPDPPPAPVVPTKSEPQPQPQQPTKPTTDAGDEFGLR